jgi:hypothetical protein
LYSKIKICPVETNKEKANDLFGDDRQGECEEHLEVDRFIFTRITFKL